MIVLFSKYLFSLIKCKKIKAVQNLWIFQYEYISVLNALTQTPKSVRAVNFVDRNGWSLQCIFTVNNVALVFPHSLWFRLANSNALLKCLRLDAIDTIIQKERVCGFSTNSYLADLQVNEVLLNVLPMKWFVIMKQNTHWLPWMLWMPGKQMRPPSAEHLSIVLVIFSVCMQILGSETITKRVRNTNE